MKKMFQVPSSKFKVQGSRFKDLEPGTWNLEHAGTAWVLGAVLALMPTVEAAQIENDPTRPAIGLAVEAPEGAAAAGGGNQLQSVMISPTRRSAIINGAVVELGGKYGDAVLMRVAEDEVVLRSGDSRQVLKLHPAVKKVDIVEAGPVTPAAARSASPKAKAKPKAKTNVKTNVKTKTKPNAKTPPEVKPAADSSERTR